MLTNRIMLGELIDSTDQNPWRNITLADQLEANKPLARRAARESVVLLRNRQGVLPLSAAKLRSVAVVGPSADSASAYIGDCASHPRQAQHRFRTALACPDLSSSLLERRRPPAGLLYHGLLRSARGFARRDDHHRAGLRRHLLQ